MSQINSTKIRVYPTAYRGTKGDAGAQAQTSGKIYDPQARLFTEENIKRPYIALSDFTKDERHLKGSFVISDTVAFPFEFVLCGYYFTLLNNSGDLDTLFPIPTGSDPVRYYAKIKLNTKNEDDPGNIKLKSEVLSSINRDNQTLDYTSSDETPVDIFDGLEITSSNSIAGFKYLWIVTSYPDGKRKVPSESKLKFTRKSIHGGTDNIWSNGEEKPLNEYLETKNVRITDNVKIGNNEGTHHHDKQLDVWANSNFYGTIEMNDSLTSEHIVFAIKNYGGKYIFWVDTDGNIYQLKNKPQDAVTKLNNIKDAVITCVNVDTGNYEADWCSYQGKKKFCNAFSIAGLDDEVANAQEYQKIHLYYDKYGYLNVTYEE